MQVFAGVAAGALILKGVVAHPKKEILEIPPLFEFIMKEYGVSPIFQFCMQIILGKVNIVSCCPFIFLPLNCNELFPHANLEGVMGVI